MSDKPLEDKPIAFLRSTKAEREAAHGIGANNLSTVLLCVGYFQVFVSVIGGIAIIGLTEGNAEVGLATILSGIIVGVLLFAVADILTYVRAGTILTIRSRHETVNPQRAGGFAPGE